MRREVSCAQSPSSQLCSCAARYILPCSLYPARVLILSFFVSSPRIRHHARAIRMTRSTRRASEKVTKQLAMRPSLKYIPRGSIQQRETYIIIRSRLNSNCLVYLDALFGSTISPAIFSHAHLASLLGPRVSIFHAGRRRPFFLTLPDSSLLVKHAYISDGFKLAAGRRIVGRIFLNYERRPVESCIRGLLRGILTRARLFYVKHPATRTHATTESAYLCAFCLFHLFYSCKDIFCIIHLPRSFISFRNIDIAEQKSINIVHKIDVYTYPNKLPF